MSAVVTHGDRIIHATGFGRDASGRSVTADTPMRVASVSKSFTAAAIMTLVAFPVGEDRPWDVALAYVGGWLKLQDARRELTAVALLLLSLLPGAPSEAVAMTAWVERGHSLLLWSDELLLFAVISWRAGARGLFGARQAGPSVRIHVVGRQVYPVFELGFAAAAVALSLGRAVGIFAAAAFVVGSFPWLTPNWWNSLVAVLAAAWGVFLALTGSSRP